MKKYKLFFVIVSVLLGTAMFSSCKGNEGEKTLLVYNWGEYMDLEVLDLFTEETGITVIYDTFDSNENMYSKIKNSGVAYDILIPSDYMIEKMIAEDMLEPLNFDNIPNFSYIMEHLKSPSYDPENMYSVPYMWGTLGIVYNTAMVSEPVDSWDILWNPAYRNQIIMYDSARDSMAVALKRRGYSLNTTDPAKLEEAKTDLIEQKPLVLTYSGDDIMRQMISGAGALAVMYSGDAMLVQSNNEDLAYTVPKEGSNLWYDALVIPKGSKNKTEAEMFIDFLCRPEIALMNTEEIEYATPNSGALEMVPAQWRNNPTYAPDQSVTENCEVFIDLGETVRDYDRIWTEILAF